MFITGAIIMAAAETVALLVVGRLILGIGVGLSSLVSSLSLLPGALSAKHCGSHVDRGPYRRLMHSMRPVLLCRGCVRAAELEGGACCSSRHVPVCL